ncbi:MAG TPA: trypsin-like peptidase domain-containing protein [Gaiellaceae bacterium]|nr:trypsin-like peptidase domain-containing protein [Gaiellaceae bacterium]
MRPPALAAIVIVAAVLGGLLAVVAADRTGLLEGTTETVFVSGSGAALPVEREIARPDSTAKPLAGNGFDPASIYQSRSGGVVTIYAQFDDRPAAEHAAQGSGFVVSREGYILTSAHVVTTAGPEETGEPEEADRVFVGFRDGDRVEAAVLGWDVFDDVAVLKVDPDAHALDPVPLGDSSRVVVGEPVAAVGSPFGNESSISVGVVSATGRSIASLTSGYNVGDALQTDAPITHGNSGGPLFDARGRVIGINAQIRSDSGQSEGVGFAIPINAAKRSLRQLVRNGRVAYAYVGVNAEDLTPTIAKRFGYPVQRGAVIATVVPESPGEEAGLRGGSERRLLNGFPVRLGGDVVVKIDDRDVRSADDLVRVVSERLAPGQVVRFTVLRDGRRMVVPVRLGERPRRPRVEE